MAETQGDLIATAGPCAACGFPGGLHRCPGRRGPRRRPADADAGLVELARDLARQVQRHPDRRSEGHTSDIQEPTPSVGWTNATGRPQVRAAPSEA